MLLLINYANERFKQAQRMCTAAAHYFGADEVREYSPADIAPEYYQRNKQVMDFPRGGGYWLWKPYIIRDALERVQDGDYVFYLDSGATLVDDIGCLIDDMKAAQMNIMVFQIGGHLEKTWTKRDAFILMDCDQSEYRETGQLLSGYVILRKCAESVQFADDWLAYMQDPRIVTDMPNQLGQANYDTFKENRHDQTVLSLLSKKKGLPAFRNPSIPRHQTAKAQFDPDVWERSHYPQVIDSNRRRDWQMTLEEYLELYAPKPSLIRDLKTVNQLLNSDMPHEALTLLQQKVYRGGTHDIWNKTLGYAIQIFDSSCDIQRNEVFRELLQTTVWEMILKATDGTVTLRQILSLLKVAAYLDGKTVLNETAQHLKNRLDNLIKQVVKEQDRAYASELAWQDYTRPIVDYAREHGL